MKSVVHGGTFDISNYGDLLFPLLLERRLREFSVTHFSPTASSPVWSDCVPVTSTESLLGTRVDGIIVGGGNIVRAMPTRLHRYDVAEATHTAYADLWICSALAADQSVPVIWNAPGVPGHFETEFVGIVRAALRRANYLSVRDEESRNCLLEIDPGLEIMVVPDSAWDLPRLWTPAELDASYSKLLEELGGTNSDRTVSIHVNARYISDMPMEALAAILDGLAMSLDARPLLIAIGPCHNDDKTARDVARHMSSRPMVLDRPESLVQVAAALSRSCFYVGSSMHGYITAAAFGVPAIAVATGKHKFEGTTRQVNAPETLVSSWAEAPGVLSKLDRETLLPRIHAGVRQAQDELDSHWSRIAELLKAPASGRNSLREAAFYRCRAGVLAASGRYNETRNTELREITRRCEARGMDVGRREAERAAKLEAALAVQREATGAARREAALAAKREAALAVQREAALAAKLEREAAARVQLAAELADLQKNSETPGWLVKRLWRVVRNSVRPA